jgi:hypothetical protein
MEIDGDYMAGTIITFYSFRGGTGRTMALSNVAWIMASNGFKVLAIDWDLDSPGLHRYLRPFLHDPELIKTPGLIDFLSDVARQARPSTLAPLPSFKTYVAELNYNFPKGGSIAFLPAGRQDENYGKRVNDFSRRHYKQLGEGKFLSATQQALRAKYDYVLIDSRTGVSDVSGICTTQMPDLLVVLFALNHQDIRGATAVASSIRARRGDAFHIFPVPTRIEQGEQEKLAAGMAYARRMFAPFLLHVQTDRRVIDPTQQMAYWHDVETPYNSFYAFEEVIAAFQDEPRSRWGVLAPSERLASWITGTAMSVKPEGEERRKELVKAYAFNLNETVMLGASPVKGESILARLVRITRRWLRRHLWQLATIMLAGVILVGLWFGWPFPLAKMYLQLLHGEHAPTKSTVPPARQNHSPKSEPSALQPSDER